MSTAGPVLVGVKRKAKKQASGMNEISDEEAMSAFHVPSSPAAKVARAPVQPPSPETMEFDGVNEMVETFPLGHAAVEAANSSRHANSSGGGVRNIANELRFLKSLPDTVLMKKFVEKRVHRVMDLPVGTFITVRSYRTETGGKYDPYPVVKADFSEEVGVELALPGRYLSNLETRAMPFHMVYAGTCESNGKTIQRVEFINMKTLSRAMGGN